MKKVKDAFSKLAVSRQRKWQLRKLAKGLCMICGESLATSQYCLKHAIAHREAKRRRYNSLTYRLADQANGKAASK